MGATATVKGGLFESAGLNTLTQVQGTGPGRRRIRQIFGRQGLAVMRELAHQLDGVAPGANATVTRGRVAASAEQGGKRTIEQLTLVNRNTAFADQVEVFTDFLKPLTADTTFGASPPANKDGNPLGTR